jgi:hypothetical protein
MSTDAQNRFISALKDHEKELAEIGFSHLLTDKKGYATYITYKATSNIQVLFMYGPPDWHIEFTLTINGTKYEFKDLLQNSAITQWTRDNSLELQRNDLLTEEVNWFVNLLSFIITAQPLTD